MKIIALKETAAHEKRVSLTPEVTKKLVDLGHHIYIEKGAGTEAGMPDTAYEQAGAKIVTDVAKQLVDMDIITHVSPPAQNDIKGAKQNAILISLIKPHQNGPLLQDLAKNKITTLSLEMIPRISRAQSMDVLSSQSNLAGYKAVIDAVSEYGKAIPLMMTAAGTIPPAKILIIGAGVAGLQAIATARRLGAIVSAFDVRSAAKEQVQSLGATFVEVPAEESGDSAGGYAKEMSEDYKKRQGEKLAEVLKTQDIVITTALIPGKPAPLLITADMVKSMKPGSIIVDMAVENGGNCEFAEFGKTVEKNGVKIIGHANIPSLLAYDSSQLFARNILSLLKIMTTKEGADVHLDFNDEIIKGACLTHDGSIIHQAFATLASTKTTTSTTPSDVAPKKTAKTASTASTASAKAKKSKEAATNPVKKDSTPKADA